MGRPLNDLGWFVFLALLMVICFAVLTICDWVKAGQPMEQEAVAGLDKPMVMPEELRTSPVEFSTAYIREFHESICAGLAPACYDSVRATRRWKEAPRIAEGIVAAAEAEGVSWAVLLVIVRAESSYDDRALGKIGERGLVQVHGEAAKGFDLSTAEGQLAAGAAWWAHCRELCGGDRLRALQAYQTGRCSGKARGAPKRLELIAEVEQAFAGR